MDKVNLEKLDKNGFLFYEQMPIEPPIKDHDIRLVTLPVKALFEWSDKIVSECDEDGNVIEYVSGFVMKILPEKIVYNGQKTVYFGSQCGG